ncbi:hypothetical protein KIN20_019260 [Parelaphostrongylus tenuis]|uniref:Uncharacterized protein n=1 Tax=Parelaphostrongylus tenuis TaxID=148309 RepID=A0AAD5QSQ1_PARTN|nr:hypothetical protein KIN20_019260 [Parelaphostrongylus tenuis]
MAALKLMPMNVLLLVDVTHIHNGSCRHARRTTVSCAAQDFNGVVNVLMHIWLPQ